MVSGARRGDRHRLVRWCALDSGGGAGMQEAFLQESHCPSRLWMLQHPHGSGRRLTVCRRVAHTSQLQAAAKAGSLALTPPQSHPSRYSAGRAAAIKRRSRASLTGPGTGAGTAQWGGVARCAASGGPGRRGCLKERSLPQFTNFGLGRGTSSAASGPGSSGRRGKG